MEEKETFRSKDRSNLIAASLASILCLAAAGRFVGPEVASLFLILDVPFLGLLLISSRQSLVIDYGARQIIQRSWRSKAIGIDEVVLCHVQELATDSPPFLAVSLQTRTGEFKVKSAFASAKLVSSLEQLFNGKFKREKIT